MSNEPEPIDLSPAPAGVAERIDSMLIEAGLAAEMDDETLEAMYAGRLKWTLELPFDERGLAAIEVWNVDGEHVATATAHWSRITRPV